MQLKYSIPLLIVMTFMVGCGSQPGLRGKVVFSDDKSPLTQGIVVFQSEKGIARGELDKNGNYVVGSLKANDGLPPGTYKVYLETTELYHPNPKGGLPIIEYVIDHKYEKSNTSGITVEIKRSTTFDFEVDRIDSSKTNK